MLSDGYFDLAEGRIAALVTSLEMLAPAPLRPVAPPAGLDLRRVERPDPGWYRDLFRRIGADWLWFGRLKLTDDALLRVIADPGMHVLALARNGVDEGLLELDFREPGQCELAYFGLTPRLVGTGAGRFLMNRAIALAWAEPIRRFWGHTCSLDHPAALGFYVRSGFVPFRRQVEVMEDPRLAGLLPETAAPQVPLIGPRAAAEPPGAGAAKQKPRRR